MSFDGPREKWIKERLSSTLRPYYLEVVNESHGKKQDESHFFTCVVSDQFASKNLLQRHRMVHSVLTEENGVLPFHALRIMAKTPNEWEESDYVPTAPSCQGGDGRKDFPF